MFPDAPSSLEEEVSENLEASLDAIPSPGEDLALGEVSPDDLPAPEGEAVSEEDFGTQGLEKYLFTEKTDVDSAAEDALSAEKGILDLPEMAIEPLPSDIVDEPILEAALDSPEEEIDLDQLSDAGIAKEEEGAPEVLAPQSAPAGDSIPEGLKGEIISVLSYMDKLLEALPEEKIKEFAQSEYFTAYKKLFEDLGLNEDNAKQML